MTTRFTCDDRETLVAYVYDEVDADTGAAITAHLASCTTCEAEVAGLGGVRRALGLWTPPAPPLRFSIVADTEATRPARAGWQAVPYWAQVAAATLALAVGAAVANVQVRHDAAGWTVSTGWMTPRLAPAAAAPGTAEWQPALAALEESLRREFAASHTIEAAPAAAAAATSIDQATIARVRALIQDSERRQQQELALRLTQFGRDMDLQRRADLVRIDQGIGQLEGRTGAEVARQREMLNYIVRAGMRPPQ